MRRRDRWLTTFLAQASPGNSVTILRNGTTAFPAMLEAAERARHFIFLEFYKIAADTTGWAFARLLADKASLGCPVYMIYDAIGSLETGEGFFDYLREHGVRLLEFNPYTPLLNKHWGLLHRDHRKMLIVDGRIGFVGGINLTDEYTVTAQSDAWRDTDIRIEGPAVRELQRLFLSTWQSKGGGRIEPANLFPAIEQAGDVILKILGSKERKNRRRIRRAYINAIKNSRTYVYIENAYFVPDRGIQRVIRNALRRGVAVSLILPETSDIMAVQYASRKLYHRFLKWGARIFLWHGTILHAKTAVIDDTWSTVGSFNIDRISLLHNLEVNVAVLDTAFCTNMRIMFQEDMNNCLELNAAAWKNRPLVGRLLETLFHLLRYWL